MKTFKSFKANLEEKTLTPAEKKKREEVAKAIERENPNMPMVMKMAIATKTAKRVAEEEELDELNQMTLQRYASKAYRVGMQGGPKSAKHLAGAQRAKEKLKYGDYSEEVKDDYARKVDKYLKKKYNKEEIEQVDEVSKKTAVSYIQKKVSQIAKRPGDTMLYTTKMTDKDYSNLKRAYKRAGVKEDNELEEATQFKSKEDAVKYAKEKVKTHRDPEDGIEIYSHGEGYRVSHTSNTAGRNSLKKMGAKHVGTIFKEEVELDEAGPFSYGAKSPKKGSVAYNAMMKRKEQDNKPPIEPKDQMVGVAKLRKEEVEQLEEYYTIHPHKDGKPEIIGSPTKWHGSAISKTLEHTKAGHTVTVNYKDHKGVVDSVTIKPGQHVKKALDGLKTERTEEEVHYCAKHVYSNVYGEGLVLEGQHADPDEQGNIEWYVVEFASGPKKVYTEKLDIMVAEYHGNHKKKRMTNG